ncbi:MAG: hypothetical protein EOP07_14985 [Proteobacteria bacterium]|nr:MAG: hypothetical protein EOP07_14985 [Pseudomonadota bacterium]
MPYFNRVTGMKLEVRVILTIALFVVVGFTATLDGQEFNFTLRLFGVCITTLGLWIPLLVNRKGTVSNTVALVFVILTGSAFFCTLWYLPRAFKFQNDFNDRQIEYSRREKEEANKILELE